MSNHANKHTLPPVLVLVNFVHTITFGRSNTNLLILPNKSIKYSLKWNVWAVRENN